MRLPVLGVIVAAALALAPAAAATPYIHAHRGGPLVEGKPKYPENTMPAFRAAASLGFVLELDVKLTRDRVPVVIHDATLDRTTDCSGRVDAKTLAELGDCEVDILGTEGNSIQLGTNDSRRSRVPTLAKVLGLAKGEEVAVNLELKNLPTDPDFDLTDGYANTVIDGIEAAGFPPSRLILQSFWPPNLTAASSRLPGAETSLLTLSALNEAGPAFAAGNGHRWVSPAWPVSPAYIPEAHALGREVVPYTLDSGSQIRDAFAAGVDALISNDPVKARRVIGEVKPPAEPIPPPPSAEACRATRAARSIPAIEAYDPEPGAPRVFAMQFKQELRHVEGYDAFRAKIECTIRRYVAPRLSKRRPNVVAFNEDIGLMTLATGSRGAAARAIIGNPDLAPSCEPQGLPCGALAALAAVSAGYAPQLALYRVRFPDAPPVAASFVAATDTFARGWMQTFSDMAKRYGVYILGSNNQAPFRESRDPTEIAAFRDPDLPDPGSVYVATRPRVYNEVFMWGPRNVRREGPRPLKNVVARNRKVPLTSIEEQFQLTPGASGGPDAIENLRPFRVPGTNARIGFATSLPAFVYGHDIGEPAPAVDPCSDTARHYMHCLDELGTNVVMQDEANPGRWATGTGNEGVWQPLEWMSSSWRAVKDPTVGFDYNVTPFMVGNLADLAFDGQSSITQRGLGGRRCHYVGNSEFTPGPPENDPQRYEVYAGPKRKFLALAPWVSGDGPRTELRELGAKLAPGSGDELENDYLETALVADLPFPPDPSRPLPGC